jgi:hypothetical protein
VSSQYPPCRLIGSELGKRWWCRGAGHRETRYGVNKQPVYARWQAPESRPRASRLPGGQWPAFENRNSLPLDIICLMSSGLLQADQTSPQKTVDRRPDGQVRSRHARRSSSAPVPNLMGGLRLSQEEDGECWKLLLLVHRGSQEPRAANRGMRRRNRAAATPPVVAGREHG